MVRVKGYLGFAVYPLLLVTALSIPLSKVEAATQYPIHPDPKECHEQECFDQFGQCITDAGVGPGGEFYELWLAACVNQRPPDPDCALLEEQIENATHTCQLALDKCLGG